MAFEALPVISSVITAVASGVMIWAVFEAPKRAFQAQWALQRKHEERQRRMNVFKALMATRGNALHYRHVEALNLIDVEFSEPSEQEIRDAWKVYLDHLKIQLPDETKESDEAKRQEIIQGNNRHVERGRDLLAELLQKMSTQLEYRFPFTYLKERAYYPQGHEDIEREQSFLRKGLIEMLWKGRCLMVRAVQPNVELPPSKETEQP